MDRSSIYNHYLLALKNAIPTDRKNMVQNINLGQMECVGEIARRIYDQAFPLLRQDVDHFRRKRLVLRSLFSHRVSFRRKATTLMHNHALVPRLLGIYYILSMARAQARNQRES